MKLAWIGGLSRSVESYAAIAAQLGHAIEFHDGAVGGRGADDLRRVIARAEVVVVLTDVNSHGAVSIARRCAREEGKRTLLLRRCGAARLRMLLESLEARAA